MTVHGFAIFLFQRPSLFSAQGDVIDDVVNFTFKTSELSGIPEI